MRTRTRSPLMIALVSASTAALVVGLGTSSAHAKKKFQVGWYPVTGAVSLTLSLVKGECWTGPDQSGARKKGICLSGDEPTVHMDCPDGAGFQPDYETPVPGLPYMALLPKSGSLTSSSTEYFSNNEVAGHTNFHVKVTKSGKASGWVSMDEVTTWGTPTTCESGRLAFRGKRK